MLFLKKIPVLLDNYIWILVNSNNFCIIIDPGCANEIIKEIDQKKWIPQAILLTHNHADHVSGVKKIIEYYPKITVFGPDETKQNYVDKILRQGDKIVILNRIFYIFFTPGHTSGHISYYSPPYLFCGDTIFSGGCGSVHKNQYLDMYYSIQFLSRLPDYTILCCAHEYTLLNLKFSMFILPHDKIIRFYFKKIKNLLNIGKSSLPSYLIFEKKINLFFRTDEHNLKKNIGLSKNTTSFKVFMNLRMKKDIFGAKRD
ncbi:hydroxyacylglutathione hydrolase [Buchnera aphidicola (Macrosiphoniella sanborni)]|uniref:Hydroxyacylglutathione hydrolase n=1 Tax=Buchnera aphidicola (Macrosiphoniella sanborni) TaxID=1241865 RepID=A0A4D6Y2I4_9GAMM|nr:hydroxyacylglutathione hydrolase [Buchnera aphidicola]QCI23792.1 hydroxyacylglutathione hydrolase [Buchnera aphidicola (Macrosiphoniella sanborni)]